MRHNRLLKRPTASFSVARSLTVQLPVRFEALAPCGLGAGVLSNLSATQPFAISSFWIQPDGLIPACQQGDSRGLLRGQL